MFVTSCKLGQSSDQLRFLFYKVIEIAANDPLICLARWERSLNGSYVSQVQRYGYILQCVTHMCYILQKLERWHSVAHISCKPRVICPPVYDPYVLHFAKASEMTFSGPYFLQAQSYSDIIMSSSIWPICVMFCKTRDVLQWPIRYVLQDQIFFVSSICHARLETWLFFSFFLQNQRDVL